ncbi:MAG TPA: FHA domain-containing protein [Polyangiaceae bacterium]|nr:FHA domain-containing protein [Polyangiaceae bacterium]
MIHEKGGTERREVFEGAEISVGRVQGNELVLPKGNVSKRHARLLFREGRFIVTDLNSTNGTYVNRRRITQATIVREGDRIYIGDFILRIEAGGAPAGEGSVAGPLPGGVTAPVRKAQVTSESQSGANLRSMADEEEDLTRSPVRPPRSSPSASAPAVISARGTGPDSALMSAVGSVVQRVARAFPRAELEADVPDTLGERVEARLREVLNETQKERSLNDSLLERVLVLARAELLELGPLDDLLVDPAVSDIALLGHERLTFTRANVAHVAEVGFSCEAAVRFACARLCSRSGQPLGQAARVERMLPDGTSFSASLLSGNGTVLLFTRRARAPGSLDELVRRGTVSRVVASFLQQCLQARLNLLVIGPRDGGLETLLGAFEESLPEGEAVYHCRTALAADNESMERVLEGAALAARAPLSRVFIEAHADGAAELVVGSVCDGADGLIVARTATSLRRGLLRILAELRPRFASGAAELLAGAFDLVIEVARLRDNRHRVLRVAEVLGSSDGEIELSDVFTFVIDRTAAGGMIEGSFLPAATLPAVADVMRLRGISLDSSVFRSPAR